MRRTQYPRGFTLVEVVVVVIVIAVLAGVAVLSMSSHTTKARESALDASLRKVGTAAQAQAAEKDKPFAAALSAQALDSSSNDVTLSSGTTTAGTVVLTARTGSTTRYAVYDVDGRVMSNPSSTAPTNYRPYAAMILAAGPAVYLPMDAGAPAVDASGRNVPISVYGPPAAAAAFTRDGKGSVRMKGGSGSGETIQFPGSAAPGALNNAYSNTATFTFELWVRATAPQLNSSELILLGKHGCHSGLYLNPGPAGMAIDFAIKSDQCWTGSAVAQSTKALPTNGTPVHAVGTYDQRNVRLWIDGQMVATATMPPGYVINQGVAAPFFVGSSVFDQYGPNVDLADVAIYERVLSDAEIRQHYRAGRP